MIAAVHAGWRGTVNYILGHTLDKMRARYGTEGKEVIACIGPGISLSAFEVGDEVYEAFRKNGFQMDYISEWKPATHKYHIDLWAANRLQLLDLVVPSAQVLLGTPDGYQIRKDIVGNHVNPFKRIALMYHITLSKEIKQNCPEFRGAAVFAEVTNTPYCEGLWQEIATFIDYFFQYELNME